MTTDTELRRNVERELEWEPSVDATNVAASVVDGIVTLRGEVSSYAEKWAAQRTAERVAGVRGIANEIEVRYVGEVTDTDIAKAAVHALEWDVTIPTNSVKVEVANGWITLKGEVPLGSQRQAAEQAVRDLRGVRGVSNLIRIRPRVEPHDVKRRIEESFRQAASYDASRVFVEAADGEVTLRGTVSSVAERREAEKTAWAAPGVTNVHNLITVEPISSTAKQPQA